MKTRARGLVLAVLAVGSLTGCASTLDVGYPQAGVNGALPASARRVALGPVTDRRMDQTRIGAKPKNGEAIATTRPVADIVRDALVVELTRSGFAVVPGDSDIRVAADVEDFWLDTSGRNSTTQYVGRVAIALAVMDARTGDTVLLRRYGGLRRLQADATNTSAWREAIDTALLRTMHDVATDPALAAALTRPAAAREVAPPR